MVVKPNTAGAQCRPRKVVQNPHSVQADTHDYILPRPGRLSSKSGAVHDYFLRRPKAGRLRPSVSHSRSLDLAARWGGVPKVTPEPSPYMVLRAVWLVALVFQKVHQKSLPWPVGVLVFAPMGWCSKSWGGVSKRCPRILNGLCSKSWGGVPKSCPRIPTLYTTFCIQLPSIVNQKCYKHFDFFLKLSKNYLML